MFKELKHLIYLIITFASIFFVIKFYISDKNVKKTHIILGNYEEYLAKEYDKDHSVVMQDWWLALRNA